MSESEKQPERLPLVEGRPGGSRLEKIFARAANVSYKDLQYD